MSEKEKEAIVEEQQPDISAVPYTHLDVYKRQKCSQGQPYADSTGLIA